VLEVVQHKNNRKGLVASILIHAVLLIIFAFFGMNYMVPPPEEEGITINFGTVDEGMMNPNESTTPTENQEVISDQATEQPTPEEVVEEDLITQDVEEAPSLDQQEKEKPKVEQPKEEIKEEPQPDKTLSSAIDKWKKNKDVENSGDGTTNKSGDQGDLNGDPDSKRYIGGGAGDGVSFSLAGRTRISSPPIEDYSQEEGTVVVDIIVDQYGKVVRASPGARGSTTANAQLYKKAKEAALQTRFNANPNAAEQQKGTMTFIFILN
jgi:TonB family protein